MRWIVFDAETADAVVTRLRRGAAEIHSEHPVDAALSVKGTSLLVMPSREPGRVILARFSQTAPPAAKKEAPAPASIAPPTTSPPESAKPWWKRLSA
jgi:hypothetical protein